MTYRRSLCFTFEYEAYGKDNPGFVECQIHYNYTPGSPETGRYSGPPENYDPGSAYEVEYLYAEREVERDGKKVFERLKTGEFLDEQCVKYLDSREECDLIDDDDGPDADDCRDEMRDRMMTEGK